VRRNGQPPDFVIAGHPKSGTSALYAMLDQHPDIFMSPSKEPGFFGSGDIASDKAGSRYFALFAGAEPHQLRGEATTEYLRSERAASELASYNPDAKAILILREPASFIWSWHLWQVRHGYHGILDLESALADEGRPGSPIFYSDYVRYTEQIQRFQAALSRDQVLVLIYDDFQESNRDTVKDILQFLEVDASIEPEPIVRNVAEGVRFPATSQAIRRVISDRGVGARVVHKAIRALTTDGARRVIMAAVDRHVLGTEPPPPDPRLMAALRERFASEVRKVGAYLDRDLCTLWDYPR